MSSDETEHQVYELRRLSSVIRARLDCETTMVNDINACLERLASLQPGWEIVLVADILLMHQSERRSRQCRLLSAAIRIPGGVSVGTLTEDQNGAISNGPCLNREGFRFLPFSEAPGLIQQLVLPLIPYTLDALCDDLESRI
ncbi:MAG: hypothetical protein O3C17_14650 [Planctomycetota bacterium]|nr:hypothetical protein [Planctomycetota bacterium]